MRRAEIIASRDLAAEAHATARAALELLDETVPDRTVALAKRAADTAWELLLALNVEVDDSFSRPETGS